MGSDILQRHRQLLDNLEDARAKLHEAEQALFANETELAKVIRKNPLMRYIGLMGPENDLSDFLGGDLDPDRPSIGTDAPEEILPQNTHTFDPVVPEVVLDDPAERLFSVYPYLGLADSLHASSQEAVVDSLQRTQGKALMRRGSNACTGLGADGEAIADTIPEDAVRATLALTSLGIGIWEWDALTGDIYTSPYWDLLMGMPETSRNPVETLTASLDPLDAKAVEEAVAAMGNAESSTFCLRVAARPEPSVDLWIELHGLCVRNAEKDMLRILVTAIDVTHDQTSELELRRSLDELRKVAENQPDITFRVSVEGRVLDISPGISRYLPIKKEEAEGRLFRDFMSIPDTEFFTDNIQQVLAMGIPIQAEGILVSPLLGEFSAECRFWPETALDGNIIAVTVQVRDISRAHRMAEEYYALFNNMDEGFALFRHEDRPDDRPGDGPGVGEENEGGSGGLKLIAMNPALGKMLGVAPEKSPGKSLPELTGKDSGQWNDGLREVLARKTPFSFSVRSRERNTIFEVSAYSPGAARVACIVKDVTALYTYEETVHLNESRLSALHRLQQMYAAPEEELVRFALEQAVSLTGSAFGYFQILASEGTGKKERCYWTGKLAREQVGAEKGEEGELLFPQSARTTPGIANKREYLPVAGEEHGLTMERYMTAPIIEDGHMICIAMVGNKDRDYEASDLRQLVLFFHGMWFQLRRKWAVETLEKAKTSAESADRAKTEFLSNVSHELRTPLNGILGMLQLLEQSDLSAEQREWVDVASYSSRNLLRLLCDILDFSRVASGDFRPAERLFDFAAVLRATLGIFLPEAGKRNIEFNLEIDPRIPCSMLGDEKLARQIILNIVGNAVKFTENGSVSLQCSVLPDKREDRIMVYLCIRDTGIGIDDDAMENLFLPFTQADGSCSRRYPGVGLGLSIVQRLVQVAEGSLCLESEVGKGTSVHVVLPFKWSGTSKTAECPGAREEDPAAPPLVLLVAEDDPVNQLTIRKLLEKKGHTVFCVEDGREAIAALRLRAFDCLITDIQMPRMDGEEMIGRLRNGRVTDIVPEASLYEKLELNPDEACLRDAPQHIPVVALTAHAMQGAEKRFLGLGMDYYLAKPVIAADLYRVINHISLLLHAKKEE